MAKHLPIVWETWVQSLGQDDTLEKEKAAHSSTLAWKIPWMEEPGGLQSVGSQRVRHDLAAKPPPTGKEFSKGFFQKEENEPRKKFGGQIRKENDKHVVSLIHIYLAK